MATTTISARVDAQDAAWIEALAEEQGCDRSTVVKSILRRGIRTLRFERAIASYGADEITLSRAAEKAGISVWDFLARMPQNHLELHYDVPELEEDLRAFERTAKSQ